MKLKIYTYCCLICFLASTNNIIAQPAGAGPDWSACDAAITQYQTDMDQIITNSCDLLYSASGLSDFSENPISSVRDSYHTYQSLSNPTIGGAYDAWGGVADYFEASEQINILEGYAMDGVANTYFAAMEGLDC